MTWPAVGDRVGRTVGNFLLSLASDTGAELIVLAATAALGIAARRGFGDPLGRLHWPTLWVSGCILVAGVALLAPRWFAVAYILALVLGAASLWRIGSATRRKAAQAAEGTAHQADWESRRQSAIRHVVRSYNLSLYEPDRAEDHLEKASALADLLAQAWAHPNELVQGSQLMNAVQTLTHAAAGSARERCRPWEAHRTS